MSSPVDTYYKPNRIFLSAIGLWPYQPRMEKRIMNSLTIFFIITQGIIQTGGMIAAWVDIDIFMESIPPVSIDVMCFVKIINFMYNSDKIKALLVVMDSDWERISSDEERQILCSFGKASRKKTLMYAAAVYGSMAPFMVVPLLPIIQGFLPIEQPEPINETVLRPLMFHVEYLLDTEKWYYYLLIHSYFATMAYITIVVGVDSMYMAYSQHACALLAVVGHRLAHLIEETKLDVDMYPPKHADESYHKLIQCISHHRTSIEFVEMIELTFTVSLLLQTCINMLCISFTGFQAVMKLDHMEESVRYATFMLAQMFPLFISSYPGQCVTFESERLMLFTTNWYLTSIRTRKLLNLMILRLTRPCHLTAGRFYVLNLEYFCMVTRKSMSYLTMLCSFRETDDNDLNIS